MILRQIPLIFGIAGLLVTACATLPSSPNAQSSHNAAAGLITGFYNLRAELNSHIQETRRHMDAQDALEAQGNTVKDHPLYAALMHKARQLAARAAVDPSSEERLTAEMAQAMSSEELKLATKVHELLQREKKLSDQHKKLNDQRQQLRERFNTLHRRAIALLAMKDNTRVSSSELVDVGLAFQEVRAVVDRLNVLVRTWNEQFQK